MWQIDVSPLARIPTLARQATTHQRGRAGGTCRHTQKMILAPSCKVRGVFAVLRILPKLAVSAISLFG